MQLTKIVVLLLAVIASCSTASDADVHRFRASTRLVVESAAELTHDLDPLESPTVAVLLRQEGKDQIEALDQRIAGLGYYLMHRRVFDTGGVELFFIGRPTQVVATNMDDVVWAATRALWEAEIPFCGAFGMERGLFVPSVYAPRSREALMSIPLVAPRVIDDDGVLVQDNIAAQQAAAADRASRGS